MLLLNLILLQCVTQCMKMFCPLYKVLVCVCVRAVTCVNCACCVLILAAADCPPDLCTAISGWRGQTVTNLFSSSLSPPSEISVFCPTPTLLSCLLDSSPACYHSLISPFLTCSSSSCTSPHSFFALSSIRLSSRPTRVPFYRVPFFLHCHLLILFFFCFATFDIFSFEL